MFDKQSDVFRGGKVYSTLRKERLHVVLVESHVTTLTVSKLNSLRPQVYVTPVSNQAHNTMHEDSKVVTLSAHAYLSLQR
jgi:hypothetical protein